jgi:UDP-N-acetylglucosamine--N-acetylmuramyl-(pentapeptide) pyrophosphoryl-undecaprenol N-acetylglucosamine transferase
MRVYFAPCGIGLGHVGRIVPIARKLRKEHSDVTFSTYRDGVDYVQHEKLPLMKAPPIDFQVKPDGSIDFRQTAVNPGPFLAPFTILEQVEAEVRFIESFKPDIVVSDSRISSLLAARLLGIPRICILNQFQVIVPRKKRHLRLARFGDSLALTLIGKMWTSGNTVLVPDFPPPYTISMGNLNIPRQYRKNVRLIGPIMEAHPNELESEDKLRRKLELPAEKHMVFVPISGPIKEKAFMTGIMTKILPEFPEDYEVVMSLGYPGDNGRPIHCGNVTIHKWIPNRFEYLKACDVVVARAGHGTIAQAMCYGKPIILVPTPGHTEQISNAKQAKDLGVARIIPQQDLNKEELLKSVRQVLKSGNQEKLKTIQEEVSRYDGVEEVVQTITRMTQKSAEF